jgi:hypothetical protein
MTGGLRVQARRCATCIYRKDSPLDLRKLEGEIADPRMEGFFEGYRVCHHSKAACCRGFWDRHKDAFTLGQHAQRLGFVTFVTDDNREGG